MSGFSALLASVRRRSEYPSVTGVLLRSMLVGSVYTQKQALRDDVVDLLVSLDLPGVSLLEFERVAEVAAAGYDASKGPIADWAATVPWLGVGS